LKKSNERISIFSRRKEQDFRKFHIQVLFCIGIIHVKAEKDFTKVKEETQSSLRQIYIALTPFS